MQKQRIYVSVVGFSDVERHAINTIFRLSDEREHSYALWVPVETPGSVPNLMCAEVMLVDGDSAEAVLSQARETPIGQRLIWVGANPPPHAWRVLSRPIRWASVLHDLDAVFAARRADAGALDLDVTQPAPLEDEEASGKLRRALLVGLDTRDRSVMMAELAGLRVSDVDQAATTEAAVELMGRNRYFCGAFNLDDHQLDGWALASLFSETFPQAMTMGLSEHASPQAGWLRRRRVKKDTARTGVNALLVRPLHVAELVECLERFR